LAVHAQSPTPAPSLSETLAQQDELTFFNALLDLTPALKNFLLAYPAEDAPALTLFIPTDEAFGALPARERRALVNDAPRLTNVLLYHLQLTEAPLSAEALIELAQGDEPSLPHPFLDAPHTFAQAEDGTLTINGAVLIGEPLVLANGLAWLIDGLLFPPEEAFLENPEARLGGQKVAAGEADPSAPPLDPAWAVIAGGFGMAELDSADDFFVTVIDPFTQEELYGMDIINWTAEYRYTGYVVKGFLSAEVLLYMLERDPDNFARISPTTLESLPTDIRAQLPAKYQ
jgi:uncharacterized surface protein with fasciclin (FAS1) repeats